MQTPLLLTAYLQQELAQRNPEGLAVLVLQRKLRGFPAAHQYVLSPSGDVGEALERLGPLLLELDGQGYRLILAEQVPEAGQGGQLRDSLGAACLASQPYPQWFLRLAQTQDEEAALGVIRDAATEVPELSLTLSLIGAARMHIGDNYDARDHFDTLGYTGPLHFTLPGRRALGAVLHPGLTDLELQALWDMHVILGELLMHDGYAHWAGYANHDWGDYGERFFAEKSLFRGEDLARVLPLLPRCKEILLGNRLAYLALRKSAEGLLAYDVFRHVGMLEDVELHPELGLLQAELLHGMAEILLAVEPGLPCALRMEMIYVARCTGDRERLRGLVERRGEPLMDIALSEAVLGLCKDPAHLPLLMDVIGESIELAYGQSKVRLIVTDWVVGEGMVFAAIRAGLRDGNVLNFARLAAAYCAAEDRSVYFRAYAAVFFPERTLEMLLEVLLRLPERLLLQSKYRGGNAGIEVLAAFRYSEIEVVDPGLLPHSTWQTTLQDHLEVIARLPLRREHCGPVLAGLAHHGWRGNHGNESRLRSLRRRCNKLLSLDQGPPMAAEG